MSTERIAALESLLERVQRNRQEPRGGSATGVRPVPNGGVDAARRRLRAVFHQMAYFGLAEFNWSLLRACGI